MSYTVTARKWRPRKFDDVVGQQAVTRTLRNALASGRLAQAFVFAGPRGVGKTTTARILARALSCIHGPTAEPCGVCEACVEIAEGRDIDVLEIDAATHTQVDNVREVIIAGLSIAPVRNRYKVFIIDEVHQLSNASFNALLKSLEEPPPHVVFMMATTELDKIPETVLSRSQVFEFRTITTKAIADQLRKIVDAEAIEASEDALHLIARDAEGSMRDAQSKLDQVIAFTGRSLNAEDVAAVLGLVGRELLLATVQAVVDEDAPAAFALAARAVEMGYDLRAVCRELSRTVRDLLVLTVDPSRIADPEVAGEGERDRVQALAARFSREDLLRAFDLLTRAEFDIRTAAQPRYHLEMALLRWMHLRKLMPIEDVIAAASGGSLLAAAPGAAAATRAGREPAPPAARRDVPSPSSARPTPNVPGRPPTRAMSSTPPRPAAPASKPPAGPAPAGSPASPPVSDASLKDALLAEIRKNKAVFYNTVVAQAQSIAVANGEVTFTFAAGQRALRDMFEQSRAWLEGIAKQVSGRHVPMRSVHTDQAAPPSAPPDRDAERVAAEKANLREQAMADAGVQAMLEVFPAEIRDVEEM